MAPLTTVVLAADSVHRKKKTAWEKLSKRVSANWE